MAGPAYTRLDVDERRRRLLELGAELFTRHAYDELSMAKIAKEAGISKALLYHYFPSKEAYFVATLEEKAEELAQRTAPDPSLPPLEQLSSSLDAYLGWIEENASSYDKMIRSAGAVPEVRAMLDRVRGDTAQRIVDGLRGEEPASPVLRTAVRGWLGFMDGACLDWVAHRDLDRQTLHGLLLATLLGAVLAAEKRYGEVMSLHVDDEHERRVRGDRARAVRPVAEVRRDDQHAPAALLHARDALIPARDDHARAERERERLAAAVPGGVELRAVLRRARRSTGR